MNTVAAYLLPVRWRRTGLGHFFKETSKPNIGTLARPYHRLCTEFEWLIVPAGRLEECEEADCGGESGVVHYLAKLPTFYTAPSTTLHIPCRIWGWPGTSTSLVVFKSLGNAWRIERYWCGSEGTGVSTIGWAWLRGVGLG